MFDENLKARLREWCDSRSTMFSRIYFFEENNKIVVKRNDGQGIPGVLYCFRSNKAIKEFLDEADKTARILSEYSIE